MPNFSYVAKTLDGQTETGIAAAPDEFQLAQTLKTKGLILISAESQENKHKSLLNAQFSFGSGRQENSDRLRAHAGYEIGGRYKLGPVSVRSERN